MAVEKPGLSPGAGAQDAANNAAWAQAREAAQGISISRGVETQGPQTTEINAQGGYHVETPDTSPGTGTTAEQFRYAQDGLRNGGVTMDPSQNTLTPEQQANFQSLLAKSPETSQNTSSGQSQLEAARQQAVSAAAPTPDRSREK